MRDEDAASPGGFSRERSSGLFLFGGSMEETRVILNAVMSGPAREEVVSGVTYTVLPAVLVKSQILNNNLGACYLPPEAFTEEWARAVNMAPVIIGPHPTERGRPATAKDPAIINARGAGFLFHAKIEDDALKADVYLNAGMSEEIDGLDTVLEKISGGGVPEISTGFPAMGERKKGTFENQAYDLVLYPNGFDHLAVFDDAETVGACSVDDGCGLGVNHRQGGELETEGTVMEKKRSPSTILAQLKAALGLGVAENESDRDRNELITAALTESFAGIGQEIWIRDIFSEEGEVVFEIWGTGTDGGFWRTTYEISDAGEVTLGAPVEVRRITTYEPVQNAGSALSPNEEEVSAMDRQKVIAQLRANGCPLSDERLAGLDDEELVAMNERLGQAAPAAGATTEPVKVETENAEEKVDILKALQALTATVEGVQTNVEAQLATFGEAMAPAVAEIEAEKSELVSELAANESVPWTEDELKPRSLEDLRKLHAMSKGSDYSGKVGTKTVAAANKDEPAFMPPPKPYWDTSKKAEA